MRILRYRPKRPKRDDADTDASIAIAKEQLELAEGTVAFDEELYANLEKVQNTIDRNVSGGAMLQVQQEMTELEEELVLARAAVRNWQEILRYLVSKAAERES